LRANPRVGPTRPSPLRKMSNSLLLSVCLKPRPCWSTWNESGSHALRNTPNSSLQPINRFRGKLWLRRLGSPVAAVTHAYQGLTVGSHGVESALLGQAHEKTHHRWCVCDSAVATHTRSRPTAFSRTATENAASTGAENSATPPYTPSYLAVLHVREQGIFDWRGIVRL
jgi:hypothetical protein